MRNKKTGLAGYWKNEQNLELLKKVAIISSSRAFGNAQIKGEIVGEIESG